MINNSFLYQYWGGDFEGYGVFRQSLCNILAADFFNVEGLL